MVCFHYIMNLNSFTSINNNRQTTPLRYNNDTYIVAIWSLKLLLVMLLALPMM